uniref:Uncharacterized protein n=1 Tax=viral metagenome TaxID=1070528 RepID=A0A6C0DF78_9ZZZZ
MINKENNIFISKNQVFCLLDENIILHNNIILNNNMSKTVQSNTSEIDKKKKETQPNKVVNYETTYNYGKSLFSQIFKLGIVIIIGTSIVYSSKVYQANIIPFDIKYFPFTNIINPKFKDAQEETNSINIFKTDNSVYSTHIKFPIEENQKILNGSLLDYFRKLKNKNVFTLYLFTALQNILATNLSFNKTFYNTTTSMFTESVNIFLTPLLFILWCILMYFVNFINIIFNLIKNITLLFSINKNTSPGNENKPPIWEFGNKKIIMSTKTNIFLFLVYLCLIGMFIMFFGIAMVFPVISLICLIYCFVLPLFMKAKNVKNVDKPSKYDFKNALLDVLKYKSQIIMLIIAFFVIKGANDFFGNVAMVISIVIFLIMFFFTPLFEKYKLNYKDNLLPGTPVPPPPSNLDNDLITEEQSNKIMSELTKMAPIAMTPAAITPENISDAAKSSVLPDKTENNPTEAPSETTDSVKLPYKTENKPTEAPIETTDSVKLPYKTENKTDTPTTMFGKLKNKLDNFVEDKVMPEVKSIENSVEKNVNSKSKATELLKKVASVNPLARLAVNTAVKTADKLADKVSDRVSDRVSDKIANKVADNVVGGKKKK